MIEIYTRDINGKRNNITFSSWDDVYSYIDRNINDLEEEEILLITYDDICIYSQLGNTPIDWEDVIGFFA